MGSKKILLTLASIPAALGGLYLAAVMPRIIKKPSKKPFVGKLYAHRGLHDNNSNAPENSMAAFKKAVEGLTGNELTPMALLGTQVVAGTNYAFLCHSKLATADPAESIQLVIVYEDLEGNATIAGISNVDVSRYVNY